MSNQYQEDKQIKDSQQQAQQKDDVNRVSTTDQSTPMAQNIDEQQRLQQQQFNQNQQGQNQQFQNVPQEQFGQKQQAGDQQGISEERAKLLAQYQEQTIELPLQNQDSNLELPQSFKFEFSEIDKPIIPQQQDFTQSKQQILEHRLYRRVQDASLADGCAWVFTSPTTIQKYFFLHPGLAAHDVRIRVMFAGVSKSDSFAARGLWGPVPYPLCAGEEIVGEVIAVGPAVTKFKIGDKVLYGPTRYSCGTCVYCLESRTNLCPFTPRLVKNTYGVFWGGFATHIQQPESHCFKVPNGLNLETAAPIMCAGINAYKPLSIFAKKGDRVAIIGVGGVGHLAVQIANKMGMDVDIFCSSFEREKKERYLANFGAKMIIHWDAENIDQFKDRYDLVLNTIPGKLPIEQLEKFMNLLKPLGKFVIVGVPALSERLAFNFKTVIGKALEVVCMHAGGVKEVQEAIDFISRNDIRPECEFFPFEDFPKAFDRMENMHPLFRVVFIIDDI
jgi:uncharacterized zinc-type alcohol dehydrogenase-like protein